MRASVRFADCSVFLSHDSLEQCARALNIDERRCRVIPIGPDDLFFDDRPTQSAAGIRDTILAVGDVYPHKRFELAIDALSNLHGSHPGLELKIAGRPVDRAYFSELQSRVSKLGLADRVEFLGGLSVDQLIECYRSSRIYVATSSLETFGLTPIEAMACGLPVIASRESATPEICGEAAIYFDSDAVSLANRIRSLLSDREKWLDIQQRGRDRALLFSWERIGTQYAELVEESIVSGSTRQIA